MVRSPVLAPSSGASLDGASPSFASLTSLNDDSEKALDEIKPLGSPLLTPSVSPPRETPTEKDLPSTALPPKRLSVPDYGSGARAHLARLLAGRR